MIIKLPKCKIRLFVFCLYNLFFVLYMLNKISNIFYLITISLFCFMNLFMILGNKIKIKKSWREFKLGISYVVVFVLSSLVMQFFNSDFNLSILFNDVIRLIIPILNAFLFVNTIRKEDQNIFFNIFLIRFILQFIFTNLSNLSLTSILSISWSNSSSLMESSLAHDFFIMEIYYLMNKDKKKALICLILCMLSMKRLSFILAPILFIFSNFISNEKEVKPFFVNILKLSAILSPFVLITLYSDIFQNWIFENFNINLNTLMSGRISIYNILVNNIPYYNGLGSVNEFLGTFVQTNFGTMWNGILHNDFLRIYFETTIIGVIILGNNLVELGRKNYWHFIMIAYLIFVAITSHILNYFSVWVTLYMAIMVFNANNSKEEK